jgi:hypothetical protein
VKEAWETTVHNCRQASQTAAAAAAPLEMATNPALAYAAEGCIMEEEEEEEVVVVVVVAVDLILGCPLPWATETEDRGREGMIQRPLISRVRMQVVCEMGFEATQAGHLAIIIFSPANFCQVPNDFIVDRSIYHVLAPKQTSLT